MEALYGETSEVNTRHHQGIGRIGENLQVVSIWNDGEDSVVEAIACEQHSILGLQWHPEKMFLYGNENQRTDAKKAAAVVLTLEGENEKSFDRSSYLSIGGRYDGMQHG